MTKVIDLKAEYLEIVCNVLRKNLPADAKVGIFGSRTTGKAKEFSDIDLVIDLGKPLPLSISAKLAYDFEESNLPYRVDVVDWHSISDSFRERIAKDRVDIHY